MLNWIHVFGELDMHILLCKDTGAMNRSPTPDGIFATKFVGERHPFTGCFVGISRNVRHPFCEYAMRYEKLGVTCLFCGCYVFRKQKGGFLQHKNPLFAR